MKTNYRRHDRGDCAGKVGAVMAGVNDERPDESAEGHVVATIVKPGGNSQMSTTQSSDALPALAAARLAVIERVEAAATSRWPHPVCGYPRRAASESARALRAAAGALAQRVDACTDAWNRAWDDRMAELGAELRAQAEMGGHSFSSATALSTTEVLIADRVHVSLSKVVAGPSVRVRDTQTGWRFDTGQLT
ncbi:uncharacterized protein RMCFA_1293 [Mycolicibacterium fortuitum subsp. acetamidolyticum]|uniref:Uncharacterized protein n=1 Tax=Mycolicibacterium fortuitum subsp. acetamidolyticum TaxID=144550 RepID=A0A117IDJ3_MYCFO|nr:uncharacterized protein RMCFA_1293 [Mycolicibacterium fortuitum subsp. acetamidolyticum]